MTDQNARYVLENIHAMVIDDNRHMSKLIADILHALGVGNIREMTDAKKAFDELKHFPADVIFLDLNMEPLNGLDFARLVRTAKGHSLGVCLLLRTR